MSASLYSSPSSFQVTPLRGGGACVYHRTKATLVRLVKEIPRWALYPVDGDAKVRNKEGQEDGRTVFDALLVDEDSSPERALLLAEIRKVIQELYSSLESEKLKYIFQHRFVDQDMTLQQIADKYGSSREWIRLLEKRIRRNLKQQLEERGFDGSEF